MSEKDVLSWRKLSVSKWIFILQNCVGIITPDMCLPETKQMVFEHFTISLQEANRSIIDEFNGNAEKLYVQFYGLLAENISL